MLTSKLQAFGLRAEARRKRGARSTENSTTSRSVSSPGPSVARAAHSSVHGKCHGRKHERRSFEAHTDPPGENVAIAARHASPRGRIEPKHGGGWSGRRRRSACRNKTKPCRCRLGRTEGERRAQALRATVAAAPAPQGTGDRTRRQDRLALRAASAPRSPRRIVCRRTVQGDATRLGDAGEAGSGPRQAGATRYQASNESIKQA